ncbi:MAG: TonB-dependent receptor, partial [Acidobacteriota bacterium]|nr:TonB-dependent receptor [Acidobacteriota bacterium]
SSQAVNLLRLIPLPNAPGRDGGIRDNYVANGSELFDKDQFNVRIDGRLSEKLNIFGRYSFADFQRNGDTAFGQGGGQEIVGLGGTSLSRDHSLALGFDYTISPTSTVDFRFGYFKYQVNVLPFDFGTRPAQDAGVPGLNLDDDFTSGLFAGFIDGPVGGINFGSGLGVNRCNCPLDQVETQYQFVTNFTKILGNHTAKFGVDLRRANNLRVPSDAHRSGELSFSTSRTSGGVNDGGLGLATFLIGDVTRFRRYVSTVTDARERQFRHFYYGQDTWRATPKLTINYGLRLDIINPQKLNAPGNGGFLDLETGEIRVAGVGDNDLAGNVKNRLNFAPRLAAAYQLNDRTVIRAGYGRSYDIGVFGSLFGHSVTQNLPVLAVQELDRGASTAVFTLASGPPLFTQFFGLNAPPNRGGTPNASLPASGRFFLPDGVFARALPEKQRPPTVDAYNVTVQYQLTNSISVEAGYVGNKGTHVFAGDGPAINVNQRTLEGFVPGLTGAARTQNQLSRQPLFNRFGWTQGIDFFCNCADNRYDSLQTKLTKRFSDGYSILTHYTLQRAINNDADQFFYNRELNRGPQSFDRKHNFVLATVLELPFGRNKRFLSDAGRALNLIVGGFQFNTTTTIQSGLPFSVGYNRNDVTEGDTGPNRPDLNGELRYPGTREQFYDPTVFSRPAPGTFGNLRRNALRGPIYRQTNASLFKKFFINETTDLEFRIEAVNLFNFVNLGNPADFIGDPANPNSDAGRINSTAFFGQDQQRNFQFALKLKF